MDEFAELRAEGGGAEVDAVWRVVDEQTDKARQLERRLRETEAQLRATQEELRITSLAAAAEMWPESSPL